MRPSSTACRPDPAESAAVARLRTPQAVRERCREILARADADELRHLRLDRERLDDASDYVLATIEARYPNLDIPFHSRWRHFQAGNVDRWEMLAGELGRQDADELARIRFDLAATSVLLDAGAGDAWRYVEPRSGHVYTRSEGLAVASFDLFASGAFSSHPGEPFRADARALEALPTRRLEEGFQVRADNPLVGVAGRVELLHRLGASLAANAALFGADRPRIGNLFDYLARRASDGRLGAATIFSAVLEGFAPIWPGRIQLGGENLGDVWRHPAIERDDPSHALVPFHKLSQWLTYSLVEPLQARGIRVVELDALTGLGEYRNGGLLLDLGVLAWKDHREPARVHDVGDEPVVEWRALTVALLDEIADRLRARLDLDAERLPLVKVLEGGTWAAGRRAARERRADGSPPVAVASDGTVF